MHKAKVRDCNNSFNPNFLSQLLSILCGATGRLSCLITKPLCHLTDSYKVFLSKSCWITGIRRHTLQKKMGHLITRKKQIVEESSPKRPGPPEKADLSPVLTQTDVHNQSLLMEPNVFHEFLPSRIHHGPTEACLYSKHHFSQRTYS